MDDYSFLSDLLETWRSTTDWVKAVAIIAISGQIAFLIHQVLRYRTESMAMLADERGAMTDDRVRKLVEAQMCKIIAEWERARLSREARLAEPRKLERRP